MSDRLLAERFPSGTDEVVRDVVARFGGAVETIGRSIVRDPDLVAEVAQTTFVKAWRSCARFDPSRELAPWIYAIARRVAIDVHRREHRVQLVSIDDHDPGVDPPSLERLWERWQVRDAVDSLPPDERDIVELSYLRGWTHVEIAAHLDVPIGTVKSRSNRAMKKLAARLAHLRAVDVAEEDG